MKPELSLVWTDEALERLWEIEEFIARDSTEQAALFVNCLIDHTEQLLPANPQAGKVVFEASNPAIRELIYKGYRIIYMLADRRIAILSVFEGHRLLRSKDIGLR